MGLINKLVRYGIVFIAGYYIGAGGCSDYMKEKSNLEKKVQEGYYDRAYKNSK